MSSRIGADCKPLNALSSAFPTPQNSRRSVSHGVPREEEAGEGTFTATRLWGLEQEGWRDDWPGHPTFFPSLLLSQASAVPVVVFLLHLPQGWSSCWLEASISYFKTKTDEKQEQDTKDPFLVHLSRSSPDASCIKHKPGDFSGSPVVKTSPSNARGAGSIPGQRAKIPHRQFQRMFKLPHNYTYLTY